MAERPANENLSNGAQFNNTDMEAIYELAMDSMLSLMGRQVTLWLEPGQSASTVNPDQFNPWTNNKDSRLGPVNEGVSGRSVEPIFVKYTAHIVHGPSPIADGRPFELEIGDVQMTTVIGSKQDMEDAIEIEVDGLKFDKKKVDERQMGFSTPKYLITIWSRKA